MARNSTGGWLTLVLWAMTLAGLGCREDDLSFDVHLQEETYLLDFGGASGTIPEISCGGGDASVCAMPAGEGLDDVVLTGGLGEATVSLACDTVAGHCYARADARMSRSVDVKLDSGFVGSVQNRLVSFVRTIDLRYDVPVNTLTFAVPRVDVFVGPAGTTRETDPGVVAVGTTPVIGAGATLTDGHLPIADDSAAHGLIEDAVRGQREFVFVLVLSPRIDSGKPIPAGALEVDLTPVLTVGL